jgi:hypothetical protein
VIVGTIGPCRWKTRRVDTSEGKTSGYSVESPDEVREVIESNVMRDVRDGAPGIEEHARRPADARADQVLMRRCTSHPPEHAQKVKRTQPDVVREVGERQRLPAERSM